MSLFIAVRVDPERCRAGQPCTACIGVCPVTIFEGRDGLAGVIGENEDECILCDLCLARCPTDAIAIYKLYADEIRTGAGVQGSAK
ncbi:MAG: 4Fe-4S binding protein [candidate division NC10 bacterium]|nr:4Fe-4S binding protein [candidate division NC10 bacterium]